MNEPQEPELLPLDPEIERTFRARRREQRGLANLVNMEEQVVVQNGNGNNGNNAVMIDDRDRPIRDHVVPTLDDLNPCIVRPDIQAPQFELKPVMFQMLQIVGQFTGLPTEDPRLHLRLFIEVCESFKQ